jgi:hypothetical protein
MSYALAVAGRYKKVTLDAGDTVIDLGSPDPFPVIDTADVEVWRTRGPLRTRLALDVDYAVSLLDQLPGARVTLAAGALQDDIVEAIGLRPIQRPTDLNDGNKFSEVGLNAEFDRLTLQQQELRRDTARAVKVGYGQAGYDFPTKVPGHFIRFNEDGLETGLPAGVGVSLPSTPVKDLVIGAGGVPVTVPLPPPVSLTRDALAALTDLTERTVLAEAGYEGLFRKVDISGGGYAGLIAADDGHGGEIKVTAGNPNLAFLRQRQFGDLVKVSEQGGDIQRALDVAAALASLTGPDARVTVEQNWVGSKVITAGLIIPENVDFLPMSSAGKSRIIAGALGTAALIQDDGTRGAAGKWALYAGVPLASMFSAALPSFQAIDVGASKITFDADPGIAVDEWFFVIVEADYSWANMTTRPYYRMGFAVKCTGRSAGNVVHVNRKFRDAYTYSATPGSEVRAYKQKTRKIRLGFHIECHGQALSTGGGALLRSIADSMIFDIGAEGAMYAAIQPQNCHDVTVITQYSSNQPAVGATNNAYGNVITNCTGYHVYRLSGQSPWHLHSLGGAAGQGNIQNYDCVLHDSDLTTTGALSVHACDMHGNADLCGFDGVISGGFSMNGRDAFMRGCTSIINPASASTARSIIGVEVWGGTYDIANCVLKSAKNTGTSSSVSGAVKFLVQASAKAELKVNMENVTFDMPSEQMPILIDTVAGASVPYSFRYSGDALLPATSFGVAYLGNAAAVATPGAYCSINPRGLTSGKVYATNSGGAALFAEKSFPLQSKEFSYTPTATATYIPAAETFDHGYPAGYTPVGRALEQDNSAGNKAGVKAFAVTQNSVRAMFRTGDATNLTAAATKTRLEMN